jgi:ABC-type nitrate/sulfonate/bicarbonate transport system ATPase subunit
MSGGMARRIAIARSLLPENRIILMDEPFKGIDTAMRDRILLKLKQYLCKKTCVIITHDTYEAANIAQKAVILGGSPANVVFECICNDIQKTKSLLDSEIIKL